MPAEKAYAVMKTAGGHDWSSYDIVCFSLDRQKADTKAKELQDRDDFRAEVLKEAREEHEKALGTLNQDIWEVYKLLKRVRTDKQRAEKEPKLLDRLADLQKEKQDITNRISKQFIAKYNLEDWIAEATNGYFGPTRVREVNVFELSVDEWDYVVEEAPLL
jgi:hypothetical protein